MAEFEEFADRWIGRGGSQNSYIRHPPPSAPFWKSPVTPPASASTFNFFGGSMRIELDDTVPPDTLLMKDVIGKMKAVLDRQVYESLMFGNSYMKVPFQQQGAKPKKPQRDPEPYVITFEFFEDTVRPLMRNTRIDHEDLRAMDDAGLIKVRRHDRTISFEPSPSLPFNGSPESIAAEFRIRKLFLQARKLQKP